MGLGLIGIVTHNCTAALRSRCGSQSTKLLAVCRSLVPRQGYIAIFGTAILHVKTLFCDVQRLHSVRKILYGLENFIPAVNTSSAGDMNE